MKKIVQAPVQKIVQAPVPQKETTSEPKAKYQTPEVRGTTGKVSMSGAGCPSHTVQWQQVSCKC